MKNKKNIERLFQESFKDFEVKPNDSVWGNLQNKLAEKQKGKKKPTSVWYKYAGVAALLLLLFVIGKSLLTPKDLTNPNTVVDTNTEKATPEQNTESVTNFENQSNNNSFVDSNKIEINEVSSEEIINEKSGSTNLSIDKNNTNNKINSSIVNSTKENGSSYSYKTSGDSNKNSSENNYKNTFKNDSKTNQLRDKSFNDNNQKNQSVVLNKNINKDIYDPLKKNKDEGSNSESSSDLSNVIVQNNFKNKSLELIKKEEKINTAETDLINAIIKSDSLLLVEAIVKNEDSIEKEKEVNRWQVYANIAPVYYNTLGSGSHIHEQFNNNQKNGEINTSYGLNVGYAINDKITIRTGINSLNLSYDTANVILFENISDSNPTINEYRNIDFNSTAENSLNIISSNNLQVQQVGSFLSPAVSDAAISQRISYLEVPLEIQYDIIERKFNLQLIGGFSTFFLSDNEVYTEIYNEKNYIGKANNINDISFSTNIGIGLGYNFSEAFQFNLEPTFKYQLNAFSDTSGNFRPYIIGVYTGLSYRF